ncbi:MAG: M3 family metallopeptidase [Bacteriovoracaceae bacterium]
MNPFLEKSPYPYGAFDFKSLKNEHYKVALEVFIEEAKTRVGEIKKIAEPTFENTIVALEETGENINLVSRIFNYLLGANTNEALQAIAEEISGILVNYSNDILLDEVLFQKIKTVYEKKNTKLSNEELKLLNKTYDDFVRNGAHLSPSDKDILRKIDEELSKVSIRFGENLLKATNSFELIIDNIKELDGIPDAAKEAAMDAANQKSHHGKWLFSLHMPSYIPVITFAKNRALREKLYRASTSRCVEGEFSNQELIKQMIFLRLKRAKLLGFNNHAHYVLSDRMALTQETVFDFSKKILDLAYKKGQEEIEKIKQVQKKINANEDFMPWDQAFYVEILKQQTLNFDEEKLRPYFQLEKVVEGVFAVARKLYNLSFKERMDIPVFHSEAKIYEVIDTERNQVLALFYADFFPRETKQGGAWMASFQEHSEQNEVKHIPHVVITCNFTKPTSSKPSLLSLDEVKTLFHEFGHALHGMLSQVKYSSLSGTNVLWDFVELPSQIMENWVVEKECLDLFARHYQTGETIPHDWIKSIQEGEKFLAGLYNLRQMQLGQLDMLWHTLLEEKDLNVLTFEREALSAYRLVPALEGSNISCQFSHIFDGGYSSGYYSYKWAEVLDADAFNFFKSKGIFSREVAKLFRENILEKGGTAHPMELYKKFRGSEPKLEALLSRSGLLE